MKGRQAFMVMMCECEMKRKIKWKKKTNYINTVSSIPGGGRAATASAVKFCGG
jgi:anaerobic ribonucleoside-triphosphate reductase